MNHLKSICILFICFISVTFAQNDIVEVNKWYTLKNAKNEGKMANNGQKESGDIMKVKQTALTGGHWRFVPHNDSGLYKIQNRDSKMYLANFGVKIRGAKIRQTNTPGSGALWRLIKLNGGGMLIQNNNTSLFLGIIGDKKNTDLVQAGALSSRIVWNAEPVKARQNTSSTTNAGPPKNTNIKAFRAKKGGRVAKAIVRYTDQIKIVGAKPRVGQRVYFFHQQLPNANTDRISFNPKHPRICGKTFVITQVLPKIKFDKPMPEMRNRNNDNFLFIVEIF